MTKGILCKHFVGWLEPENMNGGTWLELWTRRVKEENEEGKSVVAFSIPKGDNALIQEIETLIQNRSK